MTVLEFPPGRNPDYAINQHSLTERMSEASSQLAGYKQRASRQGIEVSTRIATGLPSEEVIVAALIEQCDLIVLGTRGKTGLAHVLLGSTAERVIRMAPCAVLAVHLEQDEGSVASPAVRSLKFHSDQRLVPRWDTSRVSS